MELQANKSFLDISMDETALETMQIESNLNEIELNSTSHKRYNTYLFSKDTFSSTL